MTEKSFAQQVQIFKESYEVLISIAEHYSPDLQTQLGVCGEWSAREVLAHLNGWLIEAQRRYPRYARGTGNIDYNIDAFNAVSIRLRDGKDFEQILDETRQLLAEMLTLAQELPDAYIERDSRYAEWLSALTKEAKNHGQQLSEFLEVQS